MPSTAPSTFKLSDDELGQAREAQWKPRESDGGLRLFVEIRATGGSGRRRRGHPSGRRGRESDCYADTVAYPAAGSDHRRGSIGSWPAFAFDGSKSEDADGSAPALTPTARRSAQAREWLKSGERTKALQLAGIRRREGARAGASGSSAACMRPATASIKTISRLSIISADIADSHAEDNPDEPQSRFVANAFVALGHYYLEGIPNTRVKADPERARAMFDYAASYFRDPDAQYYLAKLYLNGTGAPQDPRTAARWFGLSAPEGPVPGAGHARRHAVCRRPRAAPGRRAV